MAGKNPRDEEIQLITDAVADVLKEELEVRDKRISESLANFEKAVDERIKGVEALTAGPQLTLDEVKSRVRQRLHPEIASTQTNQDSNQKEMK